MTRLRDRYTKTDRSNLTVIAKVLTITCQYGKDAQLTQNRENKTKKKEQRQVTRLTLVIRDVDCQRFDNKNIKVYKYENV